MGKKTLNRNKKENPPKRWDKIIGAVTLLTIVIFGFIIYNDYNGSSSKTASVYNIINITFINGEP